MVIGYRIYVLNIFGFVYTDSDQTIMWMGAIDYSQGLFHEPRFYGQDYNTMLEALLTVPLIKAGVPVFIALPIVTSLLTLLPFFLIALLTYYNKSKIAAIVILTIPLLLPVEYEMITCLSRGFVTGIAIASLCCIPLFVKPNGTNLFFAGFATIVAYSVSANSVLFSFPCLLLIFWQNLHDKKFYMFSGAGLITGLLIHLSIAWFYKNRPNYILHSFQSELSLENLWNGLTFLDKFFNYLTPVFKKQGWIILAFFTVVSIILLIQKKKKEGITVLLMLVVILLPFASSKIHDGTTSVFYSHARMYLAIPVLLALSISFLSIGKNIFVYVFLFFVPVFFTFKIINTQTSIEKNMRNNHVVTVIKNKELIGECRRISTISSRNNIELIIIINHHYYDIYNYGCPSCIENFPKTLRPVYERRTWRLLEDENSIYKNILLIDKSIKFNSEFQSMLDEEGKDGLYIIKGNKLPTKKFLNELKIDVRKY